MKQPLCEMCLPVPVFRCARQIMCALALIVGMVAAERNATASEAVLAGVPVPADARLEVVALDLIQNGHRLSIARLQTSASIDAVLAFYRGAWQEPLAADLPGYVEATAAPWSIISRPREGWNQVVQLRQTSDGIEARVSVMELEPSDDKTPDVAMPTGATLVSSTGGRDVGHDSNTSIIVSRSGIQSVADFYRRHFETEGWSRVSDKLIENARVMLLQREGERAELVVSRTAGGSLVVINTVVDQS